MKKRVKRARLRKTWNPNVKGLLFLFLVIIYLAVTIGLSLVKVKPSIYRVISDTREDVINEKGIILREEMVQKSEYSGHINYYINSLSLTGKRDIIYTIDSTGTIYSTLTSETKGGAEEESPWNQVILKYQTENSDFSALYQLKNALKEKAFIRSSQNVLTNLKTVIDNYGNHSYFHVNYSPESGIVVFGTDGYETLHEDDITEDFFEKNADSTLSLPPSNSSKIETGTPVYKLIKGEEWKVILPVSAEQAEKLKELEYVDAIVDGSSFRAKAKVEILSRGELPFAKLTFYNYMINFAEKRFVNIFIKLDHITGLKVAKSAVIEKKFYVIPSDFLIKKEEKYLEKGINLLTYDKKGKLTFKFLETTVYLEKDGFSYIAYNGLYSAGDRIAKKKEVDVTAVDAEQYLTTISKVDKLTGVYNVNKGYPEFRRIEIISDIDSDYYLIADNTSFGLSDYDNIVLNANLLEGEKDE